MSVWIVRAACGVAIAFCLVMIGLTYTVQTEERAACEVLGGVYEGRTCIDKDAVIEIGDTA